MTSEQNSSMQSKTKPPDHQKIVNIVRSLASSPVEEQRGRDALHSLIELNEEVDLMIQSGPLTAEMQQDISMLSLNYPGQNLFWDSKSVVNIPTLQFHDMIPYLGCLTRSDEHVKERILHPSFLKVMMFIFYLTLTCVDAEQTLPETLPETIFSVTNNFLLKVCIM